MGLFADYLDSSATPQQPQGTTLQPLTDDDIAVGSKLLPYINKYEGSPTPNTIVGGQTVDDLSMHPKVRVAFNKKGDTSDAAGLYQILGSTWDQQSKKLGLEDFSPESQHKAAIGILRDTGALDAYRRGDHATAKKLIGTQWASIPGSTIGAKTGQFPKYNADAEAIYGKSFAPTSSDNLTPFEKALQPTQEQATTGSEDTSAVTFNPKLARQGAKMREQGSHLENFVSDVAKPLQGITKEDLKGSTPYLAYQANLGGAEGKKEMVERVSKGSEEFVKGIQNFYNAPNKGEIIKQGLQHLYEHPGEAVGESAKSILLHPEQLAAGELVAPAKAVAKPVISAVSKVAAPVVERGKQTLGALQEGFQAAKAVNAPRVNPVAKVAEAGAPNIGAAATEYENAVRAELANAHPDIQAKFANVPANEVDLKALENTNKLKKWDINPTEGQATQDVGKMSDEWNDRAKDENLKQAFLERNPKLVQGFETTREKAAPDVFTNNKVEDASAVLDRLKANDAARESDISAKYQALRDANGGQFPIDGKTFAQNAIDQLHHDLIYDATPQVLKSALEKFAKGQPMTFENFERLRTITATEMRKGGTEAATAHTIREALENLPLSPQAAQLKPLADQARAAVRARKQLIENNPAIKSAISDTRSAEEIAAGVPHPAASNFFEKHVVGKNVPEVNVRRLVQELGENSPEHQNLKSGTIRDLKDKTVNSKGEVGQEALNKQLDKVLGTKLEAVHGNEVAKDLRDLGEAARLTEPRGGVSWANTSNTAVVSERQQAKKELIEGAKNVAASLAEHGVNVAAKGVPVGTSIRKLANWRTAKKEAFAAEKAAAEESARRTELGAGIRKTPLNDITRK